MSMFSVVVPSRNRSNLKGCRRAVAICQPASWRTVIDDGLGPSASRRHGSRRVVRRRVSRRSVPGGFGFGWAGSLEQLPCP